MQLKPFSHINFSFCQRLQFCIDLANAHHHRTRIRTNRTRSVSVEVDLDIVRYIRQNQNSPNGAFCRQKKVDGKRFEYSGSLMLLLLSLVYQKYVKVFCFSSSPFCLLWRHYWLIYDVRMHIMRPARCFHCFFFIQFPPEWAFEIDLK